MSRRAAVHPFRIGPAADETKNTLQDKCSAGNQATSIADLRTLPNAGQRPLMGGVPEQQ